MSLTSIARAAALTLFLAAAGQSFAGQVSSPDAERAAPVQVTSYVGTVWGVALGVEAGGRVHVLWTGKRPEDANFTAFYSSSTDGSTWSGPQILDTGNAFDPGIAVDDVHGRVHLVYRSNTNGIIHRTVTGGVVSAPTPIDVTVGLVTVVYPVVAVASESGTAYVLWLRRDWSGSPVVDTGMLAAWNGTAWGSPFSPLGDNDGTWSALAASPAGAVAIAAVVNGRPKVSTSADGQSFTAAQWPVSSYPYPEQDAAVVVAWAADEGAFHLVTTHDLMPGSSELYGFSRHPVTAEWSGPLNLTEGSSAGWSVRPSLDSAFAQSFHYLTWMEDHETTNVLQGRTAAGLDLGAIHDISTDFAAAGVATNFNIVHAVFLGVDGFPHLVIGAEAYQDIGVYYQRLPAPPLPGLFRDGFESGGASLWSWATP